MERGEREKERERESEKEKVVREKTETVDRAGEEGCGDQIVSVSAERGGQSDSDTLNRNTARAQVMPVNQTVLLLGLLLTIYFYHWSGCRIYIYFIFICIFYLPILIIKILNDTLSFFPPSFFSIFSPHHACLKLSKLAAPVMM